MRRQTVRFLYVVVALVLCGSRAYADAAPEAEEDSVRVFRELQPSVVSLQNAEGSGTGIIIDASGLILTNAHVVISPLPFKCVADVAGGAGETKQVEFKRVQIVGYHSHLDLALVRVDPKELGVNLKPAVFATAKPSPGQHIFVIGDPAGGGMVLTKTITAGMLSAVDREVDGERYDQIDAAINPGNSGGPVADRSGHVLGVVTFKFTDVQAIGFAIPVQGVKPEEFVSLSQKKGNPQKTPELIATAKRFADMARQAGTGHVYRTRQPGFGGTRMVHEPGDEKARVLYSAFAATCYRLALINDPSNSSLWFDVANSLSIAKQHEPAAAYMLRYIQMGPWSNSTAEGYRELGIILGNLSRHDDAIAAFQEGIAKFPFNGRTWFDLGLEQKQKGDYAGAAYSAGVALAAGLPNSILTNKATNFGREVRKNLSDAAAKDVDARTAGDVVRAALEKLLAESNRARQAHTVYLTTAFAKYAGDHDGPVLPGVKEQIPQDIQTAPPVSAPPPPTPKIASGIAYPATQPANSPLVANSALDRLKDGQFIKPKASASPTTYLKAISTPGDIIGQGKTLDFESSKTRASTGPLGITVNVDEWTLHFAPPRGKTLDVGEYADAKRAPFNNDSPGIDVSPRGHGSHHIVGKFVIWELTIENNKIAHLAIDFVCHAEEGSPPLYGMLRFHSSME